jgi:hypothetical protein
MTEPTNASEPGGPDAPEAAPDAAEDGPDLDLNVNAGDPLPDDDVDDGLDG